MSQNLGELFKGYSQQFVRGNSPYTSSYDRGHIRRDLDVWVENNGSKLREAFAVQTKGIEPDVLLRVQIVLSHFGNTNEAINLLLEEIRHATPNEEKTSL